MSSKLLYIPGREGVGEGRVWWREGGRGKTEEKETWRREGGGRGGEGRKKGGSRSICYIQRAHSLT